MITSALLDQVEQFLHVDEASARRMLAVIVADMHSVEDIADRLIVLATAAGDALRLAAAPRSEGGFFGAGTESHGAPQTTEQIVAAAANRDIELLHALIGAVVAPLGGARTPEGVAAALFAADVAADLARAARVTHRSICSTRS